MYEQVIQVLDAIAAEAKKVKDRKKTRESADGLRRLLNEHPEVLERRRFADDEGLLGRCSILDRKATAWRKTDEGPYPDSGPKAAGELAAAAEDFSKKLKEWMKKNQT